MEHCKKSEVDLVRKIRPANIPIYIPEGHSNTYNKRLIGPSAGSKYVEVILGEMNSEGCANAHTHDSLEQVIYVLEGSLRVLSKGVNERIEQGDLLFIPQGASHKITSEADKTRFLVIYAPPKER